MLCILSGSPPLCRCNRDDGSLLSHTNRVFCILWHSGRAFPMDVHRGSLFRSFGVLLICTGDSFGSVRLFHLDFFWHKSLLRLLFDLIMSFDPYFLLSAGSDRNYYTAFCRGERHPLVAFLPLKCYLHFCNLRLVHFNDTSCIVQ